MAAAARRHGRNLGVFVGERNLYRGLLSGTDDVVVAATGGCNAELLRERFPGVNVVIEDFVDFAAIFERTRLSVCKGGYGSVMLALSNGVPVPSARKREGKNDINARIELFGVGIDLRTERPAANRIAKRLTYPCRPPTRRARGAATRRVAVLRTDRPRRE